MRELSVVITVMNEEENIKPLLEAVRGALGGIDYEVILVDDGSTDKTIPAIVANSDDRTVLVELRKNYGQSTAMTAGIDHSRGRYVALLDGDLQNDPTDIPAMLELLKKEDWDVVAGNRKNRKDGFILRKLPSRIANALMRPSAASRADQRALLRAQARALLPRLTAAARRLQLSEESRAHLAEVVNTLTQALAAPMVRMGV